MAMRELFARLAAAYIKATPPHPGRGILGKIAWWIYPQPLVVKSDDGFLIKVRLCDANDLILWRSRDCEPHNDRHVFVSHLREGMTVMDVGANLGLYSLLISRAVGPSGKVYAFEPVPEIFARLKESIALNNATNVIPVPVALSDEKGKAKMSVKGGSSSLFRRVSDEFVEVQVERLDDFVEREKIERVDAIKIDVEGAELRVIRGADKTIRRDKPILMVEINPVTLPAAGTTPEELFETIVSYGYNAFVIRHDKAIPTDKVVEPWRYFRGVPSHDNYLFIPR
jgi:FkbM family methyltransferase